MMTFLILIISQTLYSTLDKFSLCISLRVRVCSIYNRLPILTRSVVKGLMGVSSVYVQSRFISVFHADVLSLF